MDNYFDALAQTWDQDPMKIERAKITAEKCRKMSIASRKSLLDFGGGTGLLSLFLHDTFDSITIADSSKEMLKVARANIRKAKISTIKTIELKDNISELSGNYSAIITLMTLHHITDIDQFFRSASNILDDHGSLIIADLCKEDGSFHQHVNGFDGHNGFDTKSLSERLTRAGFEVKQVSHYFEIRKEESPGKIKTFPLFFLVAEKK